MSEQIARQEIKPSILKKMFLRFKLTKALKDCHTIEEYLHSKHFLNKSCSNLNLVICDGFSSELKNSYFLYKGYTENGSLSTLKKYNIINGKVEKCIDVIESDIIVIDLYDKNIYLHNYSKDDHYISGYLINVETKSELNKTLIFSYKEFKININSINKFYIIDRVDDFVIQFII